MGNRIKTTSKSVIKKNLFLDKRYSILLFYTLLNFVSMELGFRSVYTVPTYTISLEHLIIIVIIIVTISTR